MSLAAQAGGAATDSLLLPAPLGRERKLPTSEFSGSKISIRLLMHHLVVRIFSYHWKSLLQPAVLFSWDDTTTLRSTGTSWLDGLRGIASLQVFFFHFFGQYTAWGRTYGSSPDDHYLHQLPIFRPIWAAGSSAVCVFFVISGYAITVKSFMLLRRRNLEELYRSLCSSVIRRGFRLYLPVFLLAIPTLVLFRLVDMTKNGFIYDFELKDTTAEQIVHLFNATDDHINPFMYPQYNPSKNRYAYVPPSWTIPLEYHGSLACYILLLVVSRIPSFRKRAIIVGGMALYALHRGCWWISNFVVGMLIADYTLQQKGRSGGKSGQQTGSYGYLHTLGFSIMFFCGYYLAGICPSYMPFDFDPKPKPGYEFLYKLYPNFYAFRMDDLTRWWWYWSGIFTFFSISQLPWLRSMFETRVCQWLGKLSFPLYLIHATILATLSGPVKSIIKTFTDSTLVLCFSEFVLLTPIIFIAAGIVERYIDRPSIRFARWVEHYISQDSTGEQKETLLHSHSLEMDERLERT